MNGIRPGPGDIAVMGGINRKSADKKSGCNKQPYAGDMIVHSSTTP